MELLSFDEGGRLKGEVGEILTLLGEEEGIVKEILEIEDKPSKLE